MSLYNCGYDHQMDNGENSYRITKFDDDFNVESSYLTSPNACECPQGHKPTCRHRKMLPQFLVTKRVNTQWFLDYDTGAWQELHLGAYIDEPQGTGFQAGEPEPSLAEEASPSVEQPEEVPPHSPPPAPDFGTTIGDIEWAPKPKPTFLRRI